MKWWNGAKIPGQATLALEITVLRDKTASDEMSFRRHDTGMGIDIALIV